ncbi:MAG: hypothetical protein U0324_22805 [Polyangiales bacterium]
MRPRLRSALALTLWTLAPRAALGNGRFPAAGYVVVGPGPSSDVVALRTTFGVLVSRDGARSWSWTCEESVDAVGMFDPSVAVGRGGFAVLALPSGLAASADGCDWRRPEGTPRRPIVDVSQDATGDVVVAAVGPSGTQDALLRSEDGGRTWRVGASLPGYFLETVEVAPSDPSRVYTTGFVTGPEPVLLRSDDGGATARELTRSFAGAQSAWIAGVSPVNPDVVFVRGERPGGVGTVLSRSDDGGRTFRRVAETAGVMRGFALSDDGATVWFGSADPREGLQRSVRGGPFARTREQPVVHCLRHHAGTLYVCADEGADGYALGCSRDGGDTITPLLSLRALAAPVTCPASSPVGASCGALWPVQRAALQRIDAGAPPVRPPHDGDGSVPNDAAVDVGALDGGVTAPAPAGCDCDVPMGSRSGAGLGWALVALIGLAARRPRW